MDGVDPETLLEWLQTGAGEERDLQLMALEQLCMLLLMSDNIDRCFESCPPRTFLPALGKIFLDETAPENILEVTARAITYYLDVSNECTRRITQVEGAVKAICNRLVVADLTDRTSKDLAEQCVKLLEHICQREASAVYDAGGLQSMLHLICLNDQNIHKDTMHSAMTVVTRLCSKVEPQDANLLKCSSDLGALLSHDDAKISECALRCFAALTDRFIRKQLDPVELATPSNLVEHLLNSLVPPSTLRAKEKSPSLQTGENQSSGGIHAGNRTPAFISIVLSLLSNLCRGSSAVTEQVIRSPLLVPAVKAVLSSKDERCVMDSLRLADLLIILLCEGRVALPKSSGAVAGTACSGSAEPGASGFDKAHRHLIDAIRQRDTDALIDAVENGTVDPNFIDDVGQTLLNWCAAFGTSDMVIYLCDKGADPNKGQRSSSLHYAACFGRPEIVKILLQHGANPDLHDEEGRTALDKARERNDEGHQQVAQMLESPSSYMIETNNKVKPTAPANADNSGSTKLTTETNKTTGASDILSKIPTQPPENEVDMELAKRILQQLVPVFCTIFQNSLVGTVRRSTLALIRKCIYHISNEGIQQLLDDSNQRKLSTQRSQSPNTDHSALDKTSNGDFVESLMGVLLAVFNQEDNQDTEGKEQALLVMKSLLQKDTEFWLEQLIRLGVYEKVESLANSVEAGPTQPTALVTSHLESPLEADALREHDNMSTISNQSLQSLSIGGLEDGMLSQTLSDSTTANRSEERSATSTPSLSIKSDVESVSSSFPHSRSTRESSNERLQMLNIPHMESDDTATAACSEINTPSPTVELEHNSSPQPTSSGLNSTGTKVSSQFASVRADLVEAATAVAQALGVQIVDDSRSTIAAGSSSCSGKSEKSRKSSDDAWKLVCGVSYKWNDWRLIRTKDSLFVWCDAVAIEFSDGSNGWLRFLLDGRLQTLYSSGSPESGADNSVNRGEFITKIQKAKQAVPAGNQIKSIFTVPRSSRKIDSGNWQISCTEAGTLVIHNREGSQQKTVIKEDLPGFVFESKHSRQQFTAESTLGLDFVTGWAARGIVGDYLKEAKTKPRDALIELQYSAAQIRRLVQQIQEEEDKGDSENTSVEWSSAVNELKKTLTQVRDAISNERLLSTFEVSISDVVPALLQLVKVALENGSKAIAKCFTETFSEARHLSYLIRKIVLVLEACERFPKICMILQEEQANPEADSQKLFLNRSNRLMKAEPLATVGSLRQFLLGMMAKKWHDYARADLSFVREIKALKLKSEKLLLEYDSDFDTNGLIWYLGTNGRSTDHWFNPALVRVVNVCCSDGAKQPYGQPEDIFSREVTSLNCHTSDSVDSNFTMDLGVLIFPSAYTLRHAQGYGRSALRNWLLQGSKDNHVWEMLLAHSDDQSLNEPGSTATWPIAIEPGQGPYRYLRVAQNGKNSSNITHYLSLSGFEVYGTVVDVIDTELKPLEAPPILQPASRSKPQHPTPITSSLAASSSSSKKQSRKSSNSSPGGFSKDGAHASSGAESKASTLSNLHYSRPPTAASLRLVRKQQKAEKAAALAAATAQIDTPPSSYGFGGQKGGVVHNEGLLLAAAATEDEIFKQLPGGANNNKLRILRYRRTGRTSLPISSTSSSKPTSSVVKPDLLVDTSTTDPEEGSNKTPLASADNTPTPVQANQLHRLQMLSQKSSSSQKAIVGADSGWVDVQWDFDGSVNSYRYGHQGKFDVELADEKSSEASAMALLASYQRGKTLRQIRQPSGNHPSALGEQYFQEVPAKRERGSSKKSSGAVMESAMDQARAMLAMMNEGEVSIEVKNYNLTVLRRAVEAVSSCLI
uniref:E3 ubiquitin-protein ligase n=1 Tax=Ditylenchus dipsaci TaxID=166011 RepID=A0A915DET1_9BILA